MLSLDEIKNNYAKFSDSKLEMIARHKSSSLSPEVNEILQEELKKRNITLDFEMTNSEEAIELEDSALERKFYIEQSTRFLYILIFGFLSFILIFLFYEHLFHKKILRKLIFLPVILLGVQLGYLAIRQLFSRTVIAETQATSLILGIDGSITSRKRAFSNLFRMLSNSSLKINIPYDQIISIHKQKGMLSNNAILIKHKDSSGQIIESITQLKLINAATDLPKLKQILKIKEVNELDF